MLDAPAEEQEDSQDAPLDEEPSPKPAESETITTVQGGRRRGRRRVMQKKKVKDEDGYLGMLKVHVFLLLLTSCSYQRGSCMGILFRRRTRTQESKTCTQAYGSKR